MCMGVNRMPWYIDERSTDVVPMCMGVNREATGMAEVRRCPHVHGGEPTSAQR